MALDKLHKTQVSILRSLRYAPTERFNALMKPTAQTSDTFKFHLRKLIKLGYVARLENGTYQLTAVGKEFANSLEESQLAIRKQPTLSVFLVVERLSKQGSQFLLFKRARNPFIGYWTCITDPVRWGESFEDRAAERLHKQTGLQAEFGFHSMQRLRNYAEGTNQLLEDMLFVVMVARNLRGELQMGYPGGQHEWLTLDQLRTSDKRYDSAVTILESLKTPEPFVAQDQFYKLEEY